jgi:hypothetical protein
VSLYARGANFVQIGRTQPRRTISEKHTDYAPSPPGLSRPTAGSLRRGSFASCPSCNFTNFTDSLPKGQYLSNRGFATGSPDRRSSKTIISSSSFQAQYPPTAHYFEQPYFTASLDGRIADICTSVATSPTRG